MLRRPATVACRALVIDIWRRWKLQQATCERLPASIAAYSCEQMIRKLKSGRWRLYSRKTNPKTGKRRNLGTFGTREQAQQHERAVQFFKRH